MIGDVYEIAVQNTISAGYSFFERKKFMVK